MTRLLLPASLRVLVSDDGAHGLRAIELAACTWHEVVAEIRQRFPALSKRVLTDDGRVGRGFLLVVDGTVVNGGTAATRLEGLDVSIIAQIAGG